ncbi:MAG: hypothetical protein WC784_03370, partial [Candidatus Shapirobacteria bacterium]
SEKATQQNLGAFVGISSYDVHLNANSIGGRIKHIYSFFNNDIDDKLVKSVKKEFDNSNMNNWITEDQFAISDQILREIYKEDMNDEYNNSLFIGITIIENFFTNSQEKTFVALYPRIEAENLGKFPLYLDSHRFIEPYTFIEFSSIDAKKRYEEMLLKHPDPLRFINAIQAVLFSPDVLHNLLTIKKYSDEKYCYTPVIKEGHAQAPYKNDEEMLLDFCRWSFDVNELKKYRKHNHSLIRFFKNRQSDTI